MHVQDSLQQWQKKKSQNTGRNIPIVEIQKPNEIEIQTEAEKNINPNSSVSLLNNLVLTAVWDLALEEVFICHWGESGAKIQILIKFE